MSFRALRGVHPERSRLREASSLRRRRQRPARGRDSLRQARFPSAGSGHASLALRMTNRRVLCYPCCVESTRTKVVEILRRGESTIDELTQVLDLAPATVRRHLDILQRDGFVGVRPVRRETGRPHYVFSLTDLAEDLLPHHFLRLTRRLLEAGAPPLFERLAEGLARTYGSRVSGVSLAERLDQAVAALAEEGLTFEVVPKDEGAYLLLGSECPCRLVTDGPAGPRRHDEGLLSRLLDADVRPAPDLAEGCAYLVRRRGAG